MIFVIYSDLFLLSLFRFKEHSLTIYILTVSEAADCGFTLDGSFSTSCSSKLLIAAIISSLLALVIKLPPCDVSAIQSALLQLVLNQAVTALKNGVDEMLDVLYDDTEDRE